MDSMITIVAPIRRGDIEALNAMIDALGNPCCERVRKALDRLDPDGSGTHFMSLHAIASAGDGDAHIVFEFTADGDARTAIGRIDAAIGADLAPVFAMARDWRDNVGLAAYLESHRIREGAGYSDPPGLCFAGTPHMSVRRINDEHALAKFVSNIIDEDVRPDVRPLDRLATVRLEVARSDEFKWALEPPPAPGRGEGTSNPLALAAGLAGPFVRAYLWPFLFVLIAALAVGWMLIRPDLEPAWLAAIWDSIKVLAFGVGATLFILLVVAACIYSRLRDQEKSDWTDARAPDLATLAEIRKRENFCAQNHMVSVTERKPGFVRSLTLRFAFWIIGMFATRVYREGFLGGISTIHAARWITIPGTRTLVFFSNFGGSWESYLEDFITRAHEGLTAVWSNSIGFPRARNLFQDGATDGERFKRYARASMQPTLFWYSAYPDLTTDNVRCNAALRRGLASALTNDEAKQWLALFGSGARPDSKLETSEIQSLVFGGLGFMKEGSVVLYDLPDDGEKARAFMRGIYPDIGFGDGRKLRHDAIVTVALGPRALEKLGLPDECVKGFAPAFLEGMSIEGRNRILGDIGKNAPKNWLWGRDPFDLALLVYGRNEQSVRALCKRLAGLAEENGLGEPHRIPLIETKKPAIEPFGFVDGISQPIIRGSYQSFRKNDPIHLVEPGEFIIGYPDNRDNFPPEPELNALADPDNRLPVADKSREFGNTIVEAPRAVGRNGTYLVIRQLEQDVGGFWQYCRREARRLKDRLPAPYDMRPAYIAAKLVGRWRDGSSLVRNPYYPFPKEHEKRVERRSNLKNAAGYDDTTAVAASGEPVGSETVRPDSNPPDGAAIAAPPLSGMAATAAAAPAVGDGPGVAGAALRATGAKTKTAAAEAAAEKAAERKGEPPPEEKSPVRYSDNDFLFGVEDPQALRCPFGAHIRRANPRDSLSPGSMDQVSISNRHRLLRVGRLYKPEPGRDPGLLFMCLNGDIERQFEFIQQTWLVSPTFHGLAGEQDPLTSNCEGTGFVVPSLDGPVRLEPLPQFVTTLGGGYFFMPGRALLAYLGEV
jgi:deferrochelatase/peroxidase EfeB